MTIINKPDETIFASGAKQGEVQTFPNLARGWGITFDETEGIPPMEWFNALFQRIDEHTAYLMQRGLPEWSATQHYPANAYVQHNGKSYRSTAENQNQAPDAANSAYWQRWAVDYSALADYIQNSKKSSTVNSASEDTVATSKAVKTAYDKGVEAKATADNANANADGRVSKAGDTITGVLRIDSANLINGRWSAIQFGSNGGIWQHEFHPNPTDTENRRFNILHRNNGVNTYLNFPHFINGDVVAYRSWVTAQTAKFVQKTGDTMTGGLRVPHKDFGAYRDQYNNEAPLYVTEINAHNLNNYYPFLKGRVRNDNAGWRTNFSFGYTSPGRQDWGYGTVILNEDNGNHRFWKFEHNGNFISANDVITSSGRSLNEAIRRIGNPHDIQLSWTDSGLALRVDSTDLGIFLTDRNLPSKVIRRDYSKTIKGTSTWDNGTSKNITVTGYTIVYPDGKIEQYFHYKAFRVLWFSEEDVVTTNERARQIPVGLWTAMPNKITYATAQFSRPVANNITAGAESEEWTMPLWNLQKQGSDKANCYFTTSRWTGSTDEPIDMIIKVEGY